MTGNEYQRLAIVTEKTPEYVKQPSREGVNAELPGAPKILSRLLHGAIGMATETGELQDMIKKHLIYGKPLDGTNVLEECGDVLWYVALALDSCGFTMDQAMEKNIAKLKARYGGEFTEAKALNRDHGIEREVLEGK